MRFGLFAVLLIASASPILTSAQSIDGSIGNVNPFSISLTPQYPVAGSAVTLSFVSPSIDLANTNMTVTAKGKQIYQGSVQPVTIMVGKAGSVTPVTVTMTTAGARYTQSLTLQPQDVSLIAEPLASAPALYPGKPLVPLEGNTRIVAMANIADATGKSIDPANLSYTWTVDGAEIANSSGIGKTAVIVTSPFQYRLRTVSVLVQSQMGNLAGKASLTLSPQEPSVRLYENDPLLGVRFGRALAGTFTIRGAEASIYAAPFSVPLTGGMPAIQWFLNGTKAQTGNVITLRPTGNGQGSANLSLTASGSAGVLTTASSNLSLIFGAKPSTNFFGL